MASTGSELANGRVLVGRTPASDLPLHDELLGFLLMGFNLKECTENMRCSYGKVRKIARSPEFLVKVREKSAELAEKLQKELTTSALAFAQQLEEASQKALDEMVDMMGELDKPSVLKVRICQDLMDRDVRSSKTHKIQAQHNHDFINPAVLIHAAATAKELQEFQLKKVGNGTNGSSTVVAGGPEVPAADGHPTDR